MKRVTPKKRYNHTVEFLQSVLPAPARILDLGVRNELSEILETYGYTVFNTHGEDLDFDYKIVKNYEVDAVTSFEVFEHLLAPFNVLNAIKAKATPKAVGTLIFPRKVPMPFA